MPVRCSSPVEKPRRKAPVKLLYPAVGLCTVAVVLTGCSGGAPGPTETLLTMPPSPAPERGDPPTASGQSPFRDDLPRSSDLPRGSDSDSDSDAQGEQDVEGATGSAAADPTEHCVIVAGGVTTAMLAPLTLWPSSGPEDLQVLEQQILDLRDKVPADLHDDFTTLAHSVEVPPKGSGRFDEQAFQAAMDPVQEWLDAHCAHK